MPPRRSYRSSHRRPLRGILKRTRDGAVAETPQRGLLGQFQVPTICVRQSHLFRCATICFEHHRGGDQNTEALGAGSGDIESVPDCREIPSLAAHLHGSRCPSARKAGLQFSTMRRTFTDLAASAKRRQDGSLGAAGRPRTARPRFWGEAAVRMRIVAPRVTIVPWPQSWPPGLNLPSFNHLQSCSSAAHEFRPGEGGGAKEHAHST